MKRKALEYLLTPGFDVRHGTRVPGKKDNARCRKKESRHLKLKDKTMSPRKLIAALLPVLFSLSAVATADAAPNLADRHIARGMQCTSCHTEMPPKAVPTSQCLSCHGSYEKLADATDKGDINPHESHLGDIDCDRCHKGHGQPVLACAQCHQFKNITVP